MNIYILETKVTNKKIGLLIKYGKKTKYTYRSQCENILKLWQVSLSTQEARIFETVTFILAKSNVFRSLHISINSKHYIILLLVIG